MTFTTAIYLTACTWLLIVSVRSLYLMNKNSSHIRRAAFALMGCGAAASFFEALEQASPTVSATMIAVGLAILFVLSARERRIEYKEPAHVSHRK